MLFHNYLTLINKYVGLNTQFVRSDTCLIYFKSNIKYQISNIILKCTCSFARICLNYEKYILFKHGRAKIQSASNIFFIRVLVHLFCNKFVVKEYKIIMDVFSKCWLLKHSKNGMIFSQKF